MTLEIQDQALAQADEARAYYDAQRWELGSEFLADFYDTARVIRRAPYAQILYRQVRARLMRRFPYRLFYIVDDARQHITILAVRHTARSPRHWPD